MLTLSASRYSSVKGKAGGDGNRARRRRTERMKMWTMATIPSLRVRLLGRGGRRGGGRAFGALRSASGGLGRRRRAAASRSARGHGAVRVRVCCTGGKGRGRRSRGSRRSFLSSRGARERGGGRGHHGDAAAMAPVILLWRQEERDDR